MDSKINAICKMGSENVPGMVVLHCNSRTPSHIQSRAVLYTHTCFSDPAVAESTGEGLL
jgi:hypothetical protein